jgi:hypothetical protein
LSQIEANTYPNFPSSEIIFYLPFAIIFKNNFLLYTSYLFAILNSILIYIIVRNLTSKEYPGILAMMIFVLSPSFLKWSIGSLNIVPALFFFLTLVYFLFCYKGIYKFLLVGLAFCILLTIRPTEILFIIPIIIVMYLKKANKKDYKLFLFPILLFILTTFLGNELFFHNLFNFPQLYGGNYPCLENKIVDNFITRLISYFEFSPRAIYFHINFSLFKSSFAFPLFWPSLIFSLLLYKRNREFVIYLWLILAVLIITYGRGIENYYGFGQENLQSSFIRYLFYFFGLLSIAFGFYIEEFLSKIKKYQKEIFIIFIVMLLVLSILYTYNYSLNGIRDYNKKRTYQKDTQIKLYNNLDSKDIVITDIYTSKLIRIDSDIPQIQFDEPLAYYDYNKSINEFNSVLSRIVEDNKSVKFLGQRKYNNTEDLIFYLQNNYDLYLKDSYIDGLIELYNINKKTNSQSLVA